MGFLVLPEVLEDAAEDFSVVHLPNFAEETCVTATQRLIAVLLILRKQLLSKLQQLRPLQLVLLVRLRLQILLDEPDNLLEQVDRLPATLILRSTRLGRVLTRRRPTRKPTRRTTRRRAPASPLEKLHQLGGNAHRNA
jgi:hypothetical protein